MQDVPQPLDNALAEQSPKAESQKILPYKVAVLLLTLMFACFVAELAAVASVIWPQWNSLVLTPLLVITLVAGFYRWVWFHERWRIDDGNLSQAVMVAEIIVLAILARVIAYLVSPSDFSRDIPTIATAPIRLLLGQFPIYFITMFLTWLLGRKFARLAALLYLRPSELHPLSEDETAHAQMLFDGDRRTALSTFTDNWRFGAFVMVAVTLYILFFTDANNRASAVAIRPLLLTATSIYFVLGLIWNAWGRMRYLRTSWQSRKLQEPTSLMLHWTRYLVLLLLFAAIPAVILPGGYEIPLGWLNNLFGFINFNSGQQRGNAVPPKGLLPVTPRPTPIPRVQPHSTPGPDLSWLPILLFWVVTVVLLVYALRVLSRTGLGKFQLPNFFFLQWLATGWNFLLNLFKFNVRLKKTEALVGAEIINEDVRPGLFDFLRPDRPPADPRARIRFYYKKLLRKGAKSNLPRAKGMTPDEYARYLQSQIATPTEAAPDLYGLTDSFAEARYSPHSISAEQAEQVEQQWQRLESQIQIEKKDE